MDVTPTTPKQQPIIIPHTITNDASSLDHDHELENRLNDSSLSSTTANLLRECASSISRNDDSRNVRRLLWTLNELASPYGDRHERLAYYFLQALLRRAVEYSPGGTLVPVDTKNNRSFDSVRRRILKFQEASPWTNFGHVASNGAMLEAFEGDTKLHVIDMSDVELTMCTQWPTFLEALATRNGETPAMRLTVVASVESEGFVKVIAPRIEKFARLMGVQPFEFTVVNRLEEIEVREGETLAVNCIGALSRVKVGDRNEFIGTIRCLRPRVVTVVEEEADFSIDHDFVERFDECLRFYTAYFDMLEESFGVMSTERLGLERECLRSIIRVLASDDEKVEETRERGNRWSERLRGSGFSSIEHSHDVVEDVRALLKRYKVGWSVEEGGGSAGIYMAWKEERVVWASVWKPGEQ